MPSLLRGVLVSIMFGMFVFVFEIGRLRVRFDLVFSGEFDKSRDGARKVLLQLRFHAVGMKRSN